MKTKLFIMIVFLITGTKMTAQTDTLNVYLEKNQHHRTGVNLVFENNSNDTIFLLTQFRNLSLGGDIPSVSGICIEYFYDNKQFTFNWGELPPLVFSFPERFVLINPKSRMKLFFDVGYYRFPDKSDKKYEVSFFMNYLFAKYLHPETSVHIKYYQTNRITIIEPTEEEKEINKRKCEMTVMGGKGVGDIRSGEEKAAFTVDYAINPGIRVKPSVTDDRRDEIKEGGDYVFARGENGKYQLVFTDDEGKEHTLETENIPFTVKDRDGNTFEVNGNGQIVSQGEESKKTENEEDKSTSHSDTGDFLYVTVKGKTDTDERPHANHNETGASNGIQSRVSP